MPALTPPTEVLFYDGHCGLCHYAVKFIVQQDRSGMASNLPPLRGATFQASIPVPQRTRLPDSMVVLTYNGSLLTRSDT
jgi:predicted DCC family thiol-disulfide oxidoreductase YuxK